MISWNIHYHIVIIQISSSMISIFSTGKMISVGSKNVQTAKHDLHYASRRLVELGLITPTRITVKLQNIVATSSLGRSINLETLPTQLPQTIYEPEQFPGAIHYAKELEGASILIFANGKVVFAGLRRLDLLDTAKQVLIARAPLNVRTLTKVITLVSVYLSLVFNFVLSLIR